MEEDAEEVEEDWGLYLVQAQAHKWGMSISGSSLLSGVTHQQVVTGAVPTLLSEGAKIFSTRCSCPKMSQA